MRLKTLELQGFKSFADKAEMNFVEGQTAFVGPNGCGKSNVVDAIKWVLGDASPKSQRSQEMTDVIFNGAANRPPMNFAEVRLTFTDVRETLHVECDEVEVGRRMYRDGESEYFINRKPCRRKDVRDLFMDTGVGTSSYSIIEQGKIDQLISGNSDDRRQVLDEAAGINKYKAQRHESILRLERTEANLKLLEASEEELRRQYNSITRQADDARRHNKLTEKLSEIRLSLLLMEHAEWVEKREAIGNRIAILRRLLEDQLAKIEQGETSETEIMQKVRKANARVVEAQGEEARHGAEINKIEAEIKWLENSLTDLRDRENKNVEQQREIADKQQMLEKNYLYTEENKRLAEEAIKTRQLEMSEAEKHAAETRHKTEEARMEFANLQSARIRSIEARAQIEARFSSAKVNIATLEERAAALRERKKEAELRRRVLKDRLKVLEEQSAQFVEKSGLLKKELETKEQNLNAARKQFSAAVQDKNIREKELNVARSRSEALSRLEEAERHQKNGSARLEEACTKGDLQGVDFLGLATDLLTTEEGWERAAGAALGVASAALVLRREKDVRLCAEFIREQKLPRTLLLQMEQTPRKTSMPANLPPAKFTPAKKVVSAAKEHQALVELLFGNVVFANTYADAAELYAAHPDLIIVTAEGDRFGREIAVGEITGSEAALTRKSDIKKFQKQAATIEAVVESLTKKIEDLQEETRWLEDEKSRLRVESGGLEHRLADLNNTKQSLQREHDDASTFFERMESELKTAEDRHRNLEEELTRAAGELKEVAELPQEDTSLVEALEKRVRAKELELREAQEKESTLRVSHAQAVESLKAIAAALAHGRETRIELQRRHTRLINEAAELKTKFAETEKSIGEKHQGMKGLLAAHQKLEQAVLLAVDDKATAERRYADIRDESAALRRAQTDLTEQLNQARLEESAYNGRIEASVQRASELSPKPFEQIIEELKPALEKADRQNLNEERIKLDESLIRLGKVNPMAIEQQEELRVRLHEKDQQKKDVVEARDKLMELIQEINRHCVERFTRAFADVRDHFREIFRMLFGGGRAELKLVSPDDILESGIEIEAKPPGKEPISISLLSGGEKALTCAALILAMFKSKPSPFCLLDEVDAPLDEHNIDRFMDVIRMFSRETQFVIISHNRRTTSLCDAVYGVTMQEKGISTLYSTKLEHVAEAVNA